MRYDKVLVVDLEATCWETREESNRNTSEIIEVGVVLLNLKTKTIEKSDGIIVKPEVSKVSEFCTKLTTLTQADVDKGISFAKACDILKKQYDSTNYPWVSCGLYDRNMIERQCRLKGVENPMSKDHLNVKLLYALWSEHHKAPGMEKMLAELGIPMEGTHHRGIDDAKNISKILLEILNLP